MLGEYNGIPLTRWSKEFVHNFRIISQIRSKGLPLQRRVDPKIPVNDKSRLLLDA
jgi:hypothetical protein